MQNPVKLAVEVLSLFSMINSLLGILFALYFTGQQVQSSSDFKIEEFLAHLHDCQISIRLPRKQYYSSALLAPLQLSLQSLS